MGPPPRFLYTRDKRKLALPSAAWGGGGMVYFHNKHVKQNNRRIQSLPVEDHVCSIKVLSSARQGRGTGDLFRWGLPLVFWVIMSHSES
jgi:hypothetical protein